MASEKDTPDDPNFKEGLRGTAHFYDMVSRFTRGYDPMTRETVEHLDEVSLEDILNMASKSVDGSEQQREPHYDLVDTDYGVEIAIDTRHTPVDDEAIIAGINDGGQKVEVQDPSTGWYVTISPADDDEAIEDVEVVDAAPNFARVRVFYESAGSVSDLEDDIGSEESDPAIVEEVTTGGLEEEPTLNEALEDFDWFRDLFEGVLGKERVALVEATFGETKISELPFDQTDPEGIENLGEAAADDVDVDDLIPDENDDAGEDEDEGMPGDLGSP